jgi:hypothetical protein
MNWLLLLTSVLCFWNVWTSPTAAEEASTTRAKYHQKTSTTTSASASKSLVLAVSDGSQQHLLQLQNMQGHPVVRLPPLPLGNSNSVEKFAYSSPFGLVRTKEQEEPSNVDSTFHSSQLSEISTQDVASIDRLSRKLSKQNNATNQTTETNKSSSSSSSSVWSSSLMIVFLITISVVSGGILAKRTLDRFYKWEEKEQEDLLAFDIAYTTTVSEIGYGSFVSNWTGDLDKFDV